MYKLPPHLQRACADAHREHAGARGVGNPQSDEIDNRGVLNSDILMVIADKAETAKDLTNFINILSYPPKQAPDPILPAYEFITARIGPNAQPGVRSLMIKLSRFRSAPMYVPPLVDATQEAEDKAWGARKHALFINRQRDQTSWKNLGLVRWPKENVAARLAATFVPPNEHIFRVGWYDDGANSVFTNTGSVATPEEKIAIENAQAAVKQRLDRELQPTAYGPWVDKGWHNRPTHPDRVGQMYDRDLEDFDDDISTDVGLGATNVGKYVRILQLADLDAYEKITIIAGGVEIRTPEQMLPGSTLLPALIGAQSVTITNSANITSIDEMFQSLVELGGNIEMVSNKSLASVHGGFPKLLHTDTIHYSRNNATKSMGGFLPSLLNARDVEICENDNLVTLGNFCMSLLTADAVKVHDNNKLVSLAGAYPVLGEVHVSIEILNNHSLASIANTFARLILSRKITIRGNKSLTVIDGIFPKIKHLHWLDIANNMVISAERAFFGIQSAQYLYASFDHNLQTMAFAFYNVNQIGDRVSLTIRKPDANVDMKEAFGTARKNGRVLFEKVAVTGKLPDTWEYLRLV